MPSNQSAAVKHVLETVEMAVKGARAYDRDDLAMVGE